MGSSTTIIDNEDSTDDIGIPSGQYTRYLYNVKKEEMWARNYFFNTGKKRPVDYKSFLYTAPKLCPHCKIVLIESTLK